MFSLLVNILVIGLILYTAWILIYTLRNAKHKSGFADVTNDLISQINTVEYMKIHDPNSQIYNYIPHFDILNKYESSANALLIPLEKTINESVAKKRTTLSNIEKTISEMDSYTAKKMVKKYQSKNYQTIKSHNNGAELSLNRLGESNKYMVNMNGKDKCLSVPENNDYEVVPCNSEDKSQLFNLDFVYDMNQYRNKLDPGYPKLDVIGKVKFPFVFLKAASNNNCVKNVHGQISVEPCREYTGQRWAPIEKQVSC
jgi:hypothetical protein